MFDPLKHNRKSLRLKGYDYSQPGLYFVTICTYQKEPLFGTIVNGRMILSEGGEIAHQCWLDIPSHFPMINLHDFVIMPDHIHGILEIANKKNENFAETIPDKGAENHINVSINAGPHEGAEDFPPLHGASDSTLKFGFHELDHISKPGPSSKNLPSVIRGFKIGVTKWYRNNTNIHIVWQRNFWDEIILTKRQYEETAQYIQLNPKNWKNDH